ncbi:hypothetical protein SUGI_0130940 [Cryptomeria japonica]|uniref:pathogenesis-related protein 1-like n=1 Tax=Cryptomeria japonica TaxID=3369 RepID=UPI002408C35F|nr:pathogenesis-related protein 1-like [Cryptomeria japonica]GLJ10573.1 hypothetical protein SUGI_0130940 [Cryptomeria japonica]
MVVVSISHDIETPLEAKTLWNAFVKDGHNLLPKQAPELFASVTFLQGEGGVGSIKQINFTPANKDFSYGKEEVEEVEEEKLLYRFSHVEGGLIGKKVSSATYEYKYTPKAGGGGICSSVVVNFDSLPGVPEDEEKVKEIKEITNSLVFAKGQTPLCSPRGKLPCVRQGASV